MPFQQYFPDPNRPQNAFMQGIQTGNQLGYRKEMSSALADGNLQQASQVAAKRGQAGDYTALQNQIMEMDDRQKAEAADRVQKTAQFALSLKSVPQQQRGQMAAQYASQLGLDSNLVQQMDLSDQSIDVFVQSQIPILDSLKQKVEERKLDQADFQNQTGRINAQVGMANAQTSQERLGLDRQRFTEDQRQFDVTSSQAEDKMALDREQFSAKSAAVGPRDDVTAHQTLAAAIDRVDRLAPGGDLNQGFKASYGFRRPGFTVLPGSDRRNAEALIDQIAGGLTLEEANALKGVLSDRDMELLARSASRLNNRDISDEEAAMALQEVKAMLQAKLEALGTQQSAPSQAGQYSPDNPFAPR